MKMNMKYGVLVIASSAIIGSKISLSIPQEQTENIDYDFGPVGADWTVEQDSPEVLLSEEKLAEINELQDLKLRDMMESAEMRAKKGEVRAERERNITRELRQKFFISLFICAVTHIMFDLEDAYEHINVTLSKPSMVGFSPPKVFPSASIDTLISKKSGFTVRKVQQAQKFFRKWYNFIIANQTEFAVKLQKRLQIYAEQNGYAKVTEVYKEFAGNMARNYPFFSNLFHEHVPRLAAPLHDILDGSKFLRMLFNLCPNWYFTEKHLGYANLLREVLRDKKNDFHQYTCRNRLNETVVIPYAQREICPSFSRPYIV